MREETQARKTLPDFRRSLIKMSLRLSTLPKKCINFIARLMSCLPQASFTHYPKFRPMQVRLPIPPENMFQDQFRFWHNHAFNQAHRVLKDSERARDVASHTLEKLWKTANQQPIENPLGWVTQVARRLALNVIDRKDWHHASLQSEYEDGEARLTFEGTSDNDAELTWILDQEPLRRCIESKLTDTQREILPYLIQEMKPKEIAQATGRSERNVSNIISELRSRGRSCVAQYFPQA